MKHLVLNVRISVDAVFFEEVAFSHQATPKRFWDVLGEPSRIVDPCEPPPPGHRNNQLHIYDDHGLVLIEDHATYLVTSVEFVFLLADYRHSLRKAFTGTLEVGDMVVHQGSTAREVLDNSGFPFRRFVSGMYSAKPHDLYVAFHSSGAKLPSGRRSRKEQLTAVTVCFPESTPDVLIDE
jgi:hypothetical protein